MKICVFGIEAVPAHGFLSDDRLINLRYLMDLGIYGLIHDMQTEPSSVWKTMATGRQTAPESTAAEVAIWDVVASAKGRSVEGNSVLVGLPPDIVGPSEGIQVGTVTESGDLVVNSTKTGEEIRQALEGLTESALDVAEENAERTASARQWKAVQWLLQNKKWNYIHTVDTGACGRPSLPGAEEKSTSSEDIREQSNHARWLDEQIGACLELVEEPTVLLVMSYSTGSGDNSGSTGAFIVVAPDCPLVGEYSGARLIDIAPTLLDLAGYEIPDTMEGRSLVAGLERKQPDSGDHESEQERLIRERLSGLGYI